MSAWARWTLSAARRPRGRFPAWVSIRYPPRAAGSRTFRVAAARGSAQPGGRAGRASPEVAGWRPRAPRPSPSLSPPPLPGLVAHKRVGQPAGERTPRVKGTPIGGLSPPPPPIAADGPRSRPCLCARPVARPTGRRRDNGARLPLWPRPCLAPGMCGSRFTPPALSHAPPGLLRATWLPR